jgi:hypothetical protein
MLTFPPRRAMRRGVNVEDQVTNALEKGLNAAVCVGEWARLESRIDSRLRSERSPTTKRRTRYATGTQWDRKAQCHVCVKSWII